MKSGFVAVVGRPNVGKSSLVNAFVGSKVSITSSRPQTTRNTIRGVLTSKDDQLVFVDTPGLHKPKNSLGERLNLLVYGSLRDCDVILFVLDAKQPIGPGDRRIAQRVVEAKVPVVVAVNKCDISKPSAIAEQLATAGVWDLAAYVPTSARTNDGIVELIGELRTHIAEGPMYFPADMVSDQPEELLAGEIVREKYLSRLRQELPHSIAVVVSELQARPDGLVHVAGTVYVERESQKGMVIGKGGSMLASVGEEARKELETMFGARVFLDLRVKVEPEWQRRDDGLSRLGF